jgi:copper transport protein
MGLRLELSTISWKEFLMLKFAWIPFVQVVLVSIGLWFAQGKARILLFAFAVLLLTFYTGHSTYPRYGGMLTAMMNMLHLLAVSLWMGGLLALMLLLPKENQWRWVKDVGRTFSKWAFWSLLVIVLIGIGMMLRFVPSFTWTSLLQSDWGTALIIKCILVLGVMILGYLLRKNVKQMSPHKVTSFIKKARLEIFYALGILFAASVLVDATPSASEQSINPRTVKTEEIEAALEVTPFQVGVNTITVHFSGNSGFEEVRFKFFMPPEWKVQSRAFKISDQQYQVTGNFLHGSGTIYLDVEGIKENGQKFIFSYRIEIPGEMN